MRKFGLAMMAVVGAGLGFFGNSAPANARDFPYCLQGWDTGYPGDCSYMTYQQCMMSASGRNASCGINPRFAFGQAHGFSHGYYPSHGYYYPSHGYYPGYGFGGYGYGGYGY